MSGVPITNPGKGRDLYPAGSVVSPDGVNIRSSSHVPESQLLRLPGFKGEVNSEGDLYGEAARFHNLYVRVGANGTLVSGSLRNWADAYGLVPFAHPFGPDEVGLTLDALDDRLGLPAGTLRLGRLTMVEAAVDLVVPRPVELYVSACEDLPRTTPLRVGYTSVYFRTDESQTKLYDKPAELVAAGRVVPDVFGGAHVVRFEHTLRSGGMPRVFGQFKDDGGVVRAGILAEAQFRAELASLVASKAKKLQFARTVHPALPLASPSDREKWHAVRGIIADGGIDAALLGVRADVEVGHLTADEGKAHRRALRKLYHDPAYSVISDLAAEFAAAIDAAVGVASL